MKTSNLIKKHLKWLKNNEITVNIFSFIDCEGDIREIHRIKGKWIIQP